MQPLRTEFSPFPVLETQRLILRRRLLSDLPVLITLRNAIRIRTEEEIREQMEKTEKEIDANNLVAWSVTLRENGRMIGDISFWRILKEHYRAEIGYSLLEEFRQKGFATEAMRVVLDYGFRTMQLHSVEANVGPENTASVRLLEKYGFVQEGYFRENYVVNGKFVNSASYSLLVDDYNKLYLPGPGR